MLRVAGQTATPIVLEFSVELMVSRGVLKIFFSTGNAGPIQLV